MGPVVPVRACAAQLCPYRRSDVYPAGAQLSGRAGPSPRSVSPGIGMRRAADRHSGLRSRTRVQHLILRAAGVRGDVADLCLADRRRGDRRIHATGLRNRISEHAGPGHCHRRSAAHHRSQSLRRIHAVGLGTRGATNAARRHLQGRRDCRVRSAGDAQAAEDDDGNGSLPARTGVAHPVGPKFRTRGSRIDVP